ncbi:MAG TPA: UDP-2,3-diacylglucosamine diphosphatase [Burkholderiales bacterium]|nr:UDP-2,3-diacylglucosamine diphosphatase [Burkholderiales bacterium]
MAGELFVSDLHLSESRPAANEAFFGFVEGPATRARALYILGDLFEYWIGDDDLATPFHAVIAGFLRRLSTSGVEVHVMHGNRDFLLAQAFCEASGARLLEDPVVVPAGGVPTLLMHGDTLCTRDVDYQAWRSQARSKDWQRRFLERSLQERREAILALRQRSREAVKAKPASIMDVDPGAVEEAFRRHGVARLIHGHTHRPGHHVLEVDGRRCERWVLPDWYGTGGYLATVEGSTPRLVRFS